MTQASESAVDWRREWERQSIYLRLQEGSPMVLWVNGDEVEPLTEGAAKGVTFGWGRADEGTMALALAIVAKLVAVGLVDPGQATEKAHFLHDEVLVKLPADEHYDLHLGYLKLVLG
ncbi:MULTISPECIES: hypothetical protein [Aeromonas]|uniref:hypothetical protein n=1 Tax=Aeromonas TaxID=642 RepID=UPI000DCF976B|nr:hypothetical protein [Aeromonas media]TNI71826.1 hypothetical protein CF122_09395 [Aeromonas media]